ncbi:sigma-70 family RNA polymerase sigma factor [Patulibacter defluvii]|uniref:sigma-70 family RNA polymerase sigma factor n=1 Tax=Patulibacter defluvii TaxID=3095358 RepID=UPI002A754457|nr:FliA/WhiG family RNA polymerase sigma factor [Patulibacter sp. DM4]
MRGPTPHSTPRATRRASSADLLTQWRAYRTTGDRRIRDRLVTRLTPLVRHIVNRKVRQLPAYCEIDDLAAAGLEALVVSIERFDPDRGATLEQYVWTRIHGAVLDELRRRDWAPRSLRRWERSYEQAARELRGSLEREPTDHELAGHLGAPVAEVRERRAQLAIAEVESLSATVVAADDRPIARIDTVRSEDRTADPDAVASRNEARELLLDAVGTLPERERHVAMLLYVEGLRLREIGELIGVSESRVCQIASTMRKRLRTALGEHAELLVAATE